MQPFTDIWEITPETAHPRARQLLGDDSVVWDYGDDDSPLGNDTGADTFASFLSFRAAQPAGPVRQFLSEELASMEIPDEHWDLLDPEALQKALDADGGFSVLQRDDVVLGLAFAQLVLEGTVDDQVRRLALLALQRQGTNVVLSFRGGDPNGIEGRKDQLAEFRDILERV